VYFSEDRSHSFSISAAIPSFSAWALISSNTAGRTKVSVISATTFIAYCTGNIAGTQVMRGKPYLPPHRAKMADDGTETDSDAPRYVRGTTIISILLAIQVLVIISWRTMLVWENRKRAREIEGMGLSAEEAERKGQILGAQDVTDRKNVFFK